ncbi:MAG: DUF4125 family protein [Proteobacteria bacterium]|nr:DUF4125 family protein [Pseudomonadota bacterium]
MKKNQLITAILDIELDMFTSVQAKETAGCQTHPDQFRLHRKAQFLSWSKDTLASYFKDLKQAQLNDQNLMTFKYARMENLIPSRCKSSLVKKIVSIQLNWQREMFNTFPALMKNARPLEQFQDSVSQTSFETYLSGELESYSQNTLQLLYRDIQGKLSREINMAREIYENLVRACGYPSLAEAEKRLRKEKQ